MKLQTRTITVMLYLCVLLLSGCASLAKYDHGYTHPFRATRTDVSMTYYAIVGKPDYEKPDAFDFIYSPWCIPLYLVDLPFSLVTDVVTLPYDLYHIGRIGQPKEKTQEK